MHGGVNKEKVEMINMLHNKYLIHKKTVFSGFWVQCGYSGRVRTVQESFGVTFYASVSLTRCVLADW